MHFRRDGTSHTGEPPPIFVCKAELVHGSGGQWKVPQWFFRSQIKQSDLTVPRRSRISHPLHPKVDFVFSISHSNNFVDWDASPDITKPQAVLTDIDCGYILGEYFAAAISPEMRTEISTSFRGSRRRPISRKPFGSVWYCRTTLYPNS
jgi:hypothetical protein